MSDDSVKELSKEVFELELRAAEKIEELDNRFSKEEVNNAMNEVTREVLDNVESYEREGKVYLLISQLGQALSSEEMAKEGYKKYQEWSER